MEGRCPRRPADRAGRLRRRAGPPRAASPSGNAAGIVLPSLVPYDQATAIDAAQAEVDEVHRLRQEAGIAALIGPAGPTVLKNVDAAKIAYGEKTLPEIAKKLCLELTATSPRIASVRDVPTTPRERAYLEWSGSMLGEVSATATMVMALLPSAIANLAGGQAGTFTLESPETYRPPPHDGVSEVITINTKYKITAGGGRVSLDLDINSVDTITDQATGTEIERLEGNAHGHIDVNACPDANGIAEGSYELSLQEELVRPGSTGAGSAKVVKAPFRLFDGDDAKLIRIEGNLSLDKHAHGPGTAGGDPGSPFDWSVSATIPEVITAGGSVTADGVSVRSDGNPTDAKIDGTVNGRRSAERYLQVLGKETEKFWRSGECIDLKTNEESRKVDPEEKITLTVDALGHFDKQQVKAPIVASFTGKESLEPANTPVDPEASFDFKAGTDPDDKGTIDLLQTGKRGIGKKKIEFTVKALELFLTIRSEVAVKPNGCVDARGTITVDSLKLTRDASGVFRGDATYLLEGNLRLIAGCFAVRECKGFLRASGTAPFTAARDEADSTVVVVSIAGDLFSHLTSLEQATAKCAGQTTASPEAQATPLIESWSQSLVAVRVTIDDPSGTPTRVESYGATARTVTRVASHK